MVIKKYIVNNMNEALTRIRYELGKDAVIISQRKIKKPGLKGIFSSKQIEVTAAVENYAKNNTNTLPNSMEEHIKNFQKAMNKQLTNKGKERLDESRTNIAEKKIEKVEKSSSLEGEVMAMKELLNEVIKNTSKDEPKEDELLVLFKELDIDLAYYDEIKELVDRENLIESLKEIIKKDIEISTEDLKGNVVLIGPTGVGKTTTIAKLAGRLALIEKKSVGLITIDTYRIGAVEQLKTYAEIMNIPFKVVITTKEMVEAVNSMKDCDVVLIDTTGRSSKNTMQLSELRAFVENAKADSISLVISATTKNKDIKTIVNGYSGLGFNNIIVTKIDETTSYGALYNIKRIANKPFKFITIGQNVPDDIKIPDKEYITKFIFGEETLC